MMWKYKFKEIQRKHCTLFWYFSHTLPNKPVNRNFETYNDAFEEEIAYSIDALDNIPESRYNSPKTSLDSQTSYSGTFSAEENMMENRNFLESRWVIIMYFIESILIHFIANT